MTNSILSKLAGMTKTEVTDAKVEMSDKQVAQCKEALRRDNRGYNVQPNKWNLAIPYRVAINFQNKWVNLGNFVCVHTAAAIGGIVAAAYFGDKAKQGDFDAKIAEKSEEFHAWLADERNAELIKRATGEMPCMLDELQGTGAAGEKDDIPF